MRYLAPGSSYSPLPAVRWLISSKIPALWSRSRVNDGANKVTRGGKPDLWMDGHTTQHCQPANFGHVQKSVGLGTNDIVLAIAVACSIYTLPNCILIKQMLRGGGVLGQRIYLVQEQGGWKTRLNIALVFKRHPSAAPPTSNSQSHPLCQDIAEMIFESASWSNSLIENQYPR